MNSDAITSWAEEVRSSPAQRTDAELALAITILSGEGELEPVAEVVLNGVNVQLDSAHVAAAILRDSSPTTTTELPHPLDMDWVD